MESYIKPNSDILSESKDQFSSFFHLIIDDRKNLYRELRRRILLLKAIIDEKMDRNMPISQKEIACLGRFSYLLHESDTLNANSDRIMSGVLQAVESHDNDSLENISLLPKCELSQCMDGDLNLEALISVYVKENQHEFSEDDFKNIRLADVIASVNAENGNSKSIKKSKRKSSSAKITAKRSIQPAAKKKKPRDELRDFPSALMQYVRGFFNAMRIIMLTMADPEGGLSVEKICEVVRIWSSDHRIKRINSQWIARCEDWSEVVRPALSLLSGNDSSLMLTSSPVFVSYNSATRTWHWIGRKGARTSPEDSTEVTESETAVLARLFSLWARRNDLKDENVSWKQRTRHSNDMDDDEDDFDDADDDDELMEKAEEQVPVGPARSRRRQAKPERIPPPFFPTDWQCKLSTPEQRRQFQDQEEKRYSTPWSPYVYNQNGYPSVVGPVLREGANGSGNRIRASLCAREHPLLRPDRPPWVSISEIVRDAVARLPNGEGTRPEIAMLVQDSGYLVSSFNTKQLNQCISSALDRLQSEGINSPVMYDPVQRLWIYRFRHLSPTDFFRIYKEQSEYQRERFRQIYPRGCVGIAGGSEGHRRPSISASRLRQKGPRTTPMVVENIDGEHVPDIDALTQEDQEAAESMDEQDVDEEEEGEHDYRCCSGSESASLDEGDDYRGRRFVHPQYRYRHRQRQYQHRDQDFHYQSDIF